MKYAYAEEWLSNAVRLLSPIFEKSGYLLPQTRVFLSFPIDGLVTNRKGNPYLGQCLSSRWCVDGVVVILITPITKDPVGILSVLMHELVHATDDCMSGHGDEFKKIAKAVGLLFYGSDDYPSDALLQALRIIAKELEDFPGLNLCRKTLRSEVNCAL